MKKPQAVKKKNRQFKLAVYFFTTLSFFGFFTSFFISLPFAIGFFLD